MRLARYDTVTNCEAISDPRVAEYLRIEGISRTSRAMILLSLNFRTLEEYSGMHSLFTFWTTYRMVIEEEIKTPAMVALRLSPSSSDRTACANLHHLSRGCRISLSHSSVKHQDRLPRSHAQ
nr:hypothetical protein Iba_chr11bCG12570 [Ipomoea batatas]GME05845.1 hypothetical protein Iba_scaffold3501CG0020 [Ipomoea batatas]